MSERPIQPEDLEPVNELARRMTAYFHALDYEESTIKAHSMAHCSLQERINELGCLLVPQDAKDREQFNVWFGSKLLTVTFLKGHSPDSVTGAPGTPSRYEITIRKGGKANV